MHLSLETFNRLLAQKVSGDERMEIVDHLLDCDTCARRFQALNALEKDRHLLFPQTETETRRKPMPIRYLLGAAAVLIMAIAPYLSRHSKKTDVAQKYQDSISSPRQFSVLDEVKKVNYQIAIRDWNQSKNMLELVKQTENGLPAPFNR